MNPAPMECLKREDKQGHDCRCLLGTNGQEEWANMRPLFSLSGRTSSELEVTSLQPKLLFFISHWTHPHLVFLCNMLFLTFSYFFFPLLQSECADTVAAWPALGNQTSVHTLHIRALLSLGQYKQNLSPRHFLSHRASNNGTQNKTNTIVNAL